MVDFIDENRKGRETIGITVLIAPSTYRLHKSREADAELEVDRIRRDRILMKETRWIWEDNRKVYGAKKV